MTEHLNPVQELWQSQPLEGVKMPLEEIRRRANKFEHRIRGRNRRETVGCIIVSLLFVYFLFDTQSILFRISYGLFIAAMIWVAVQLQRKGSIKSLPDSLGASSSLHFFRAELERQRDAIRNVWPWYLAPLVPGYLMLTIAYAFTFPHFARLMGVVAFDAAMVAVFVVIWKLNQRAAGCLQRMIDELNAAE
ncbi:MAG TPA: hypothetical protein VKV39_10380 [Candidatus Sulfotelmatobacter sp.]|nr:hypothetical protein [Candidatus Sulfotelmatobacter sp.]